MLWLMINIITRIKQTLTLSLNFYKKVYYEVLQ
jgi:hypothetical protein